MQYATVRFRTIGPSTPSNDVEEIATRLVDLADEALVDGKEPQREPVLYSWDGPLKQIEEIVAEQVDLGSPGASTGAASFLRRLSRNR